MACTVAFCSVKYCEAGAYICILVLILFSKNYNLDVSMTQVKPIRNSLCKEISNHGAFSLQMVNHSIIDAIAYCFNTLKTSCCIGQSNEA